ncbi:MAG: hypothetical protein JSS07_02160 [Proteobacteria bacterium]|nr:hypothetical protein [Pseudomonadota bacterium]
MEKLPSIFTTYKRTFNLYFNSYIQILPFLLLGAICEFAIYRYIPKENAASLIDLFLRVFIYLFVVFGVYVIHQKQSFNLMQVISNSLKRFFPYLFSSILLLTPIILIVLIMMGLSYIGENKASDLGKIAAGMTSKAHMVEILLLVVIVLTFIYALIMIYFWPSAALIINKGKGAISGLKASWHLVRGHWWSTFGVLFVYSLIAMVVFYILTALLSPVLVNILSMLILTSFGAALMIIYTEHLEQVKNAKTIDIAKL